MRNLLASKDIQGWFMQIMTAEEFYTSICTWTAVTGRESYHPFYVGKSNRSSREVELEMLRIIGLPSICISVEGLSIGLWLR